MRGIENSESNVATRLKTLSSTYKSTSNAAGNLVFEIDNANNRDMVLAFISQNGMESSLYAISYNEQSSKSTITKLSGPIVTITVSSGNITFSVTSWSTIILLSQRMWK